MSKIRMVKEIKDFFPYHIALIKTGTFYKEFGKDAIIMNYLFDYKIKYEDVSDISDVKQIQSLGFPTNTLPKVLAKLEDKKINYVIIDRNENYKEIDKKDYKDKNQYQEVFLKATKTYNRKYLFENYIIETIKNNMENPKMEDSINYIVSYLKEQFGKEQNGKRTV